MLCFIRNLNICIGDLVPEEQKEWALVILLKQIIEIVCSQVINSSTHIVLQVLIKEYLSDLQEVFPNCLKPKHHILLHYPRIMSIAGPLWNISSMRSEGKHQPMKKTARSSISRVNICKTLAVKHQLMLNYKFSAQKTIQTILTSDKTAMRTLDLPDVLQYIELIPNEMKHNVKTVKWIKYLGTKIKLGSVLVKFTETGVEFYVVHTILMGLTSDDIYIVSQNLNDVYFSKHYYSYKVYNLQNFSWKFDNFKNLKDCAVSYANKLKDEYYYINKIWC